MSLNTQASAVEEINEQLEASRLQSAMLQEQLELAEQEKADWKQKHETLSVEINEKKQEFAFKLNELHQNHETNIEDMNKNHEKVSNWFTSYLKFAVICFCRNVSFILFL